MSFDARGFPDGFREPSEAERALLDVLFPLGTDESLRKQAASCAVRVWREGEGHWDAQLITYDAPPSSSHESGPWLYHYLDHDGELVSGETVMRDGYIDYVCFSRVVDANDGEITAGALVVEPPNAIDQIKLVGPFTT